MKFAPLRLMEMLNNPKYFNEFYRCDKRRFFERFGFKTERYIRCNYTAVLSLVKNNTEKLSDDIQSVSDHRRTHQ